METWTALSVQKSILQPSRQRYNAASSSKPSIWRRQPQAPSSESRAPCNRIIRHAKSAISSPASAHTPLKQHLCHAYTITHSKYHGHRRRRSSDSVNSAVSPQHTFIIFPSYLSGHRFSATSSEDPNCRTCMGETSKEATNVVRSSKYPGRIYL